MPLTIMTWNAQHFDHQEHAYSQAYQDKLDFLRHYLAQDDIDIIALMETGKTGNINQSLVRDLAGEYSLIAAASQEDGVKKDTTLGTMVFIKDSLVDEFSCIDNYILSSTEQRGAVIIKHDASKSGFAFYHANSSYRAMTNIIDTVQHIQLNLTSLGLKRLCYFGGDLNTDGRYESKEIRTNISYREPNNPYARTFQTPGPSLNKLTPTGSGYTHASFKEIFVPDKKSKNLIRREEQRINAQKKLGVKKPTPKVLTLTGTVTGYTKTFRLLDFAYVDNLDYWSATCDASFHDPGGSKKPTRVSKGMTMRSDHYPVLYTYTKAL